MHAIAAPASGCPNHPINVLFIHFREIWVASSEVITAPTFQPSSLASLNNAKENLVTRILFLQSHLSHSFRCACRSRCPLPVINGLLTTFRHLGVGPSVVPGSTFWASSPTTLNNGLLSFLYPLIASSVIAGSLLPISLIIYHGRNVKLYLRVFGITALRYQGLKFSPSFSMSLRNLASTYFATEARN